MLEKNIKVSYQNREGSRCDLQPAPMIILANKHISTISGISISDVVTVRYEPGLITILKNNQNICQK
jgi:hypothetical protein